MSSPRGKRWSKFCGNEPQQPQAKELDMTLSRRRAALTAVAVLLLGWAGGPAVQGADLGPIKRIAIDPEISQPDIPLIQSPGNFGAFGAAGGIGAALDQKEAGKAFREYM